MATIAAAPSARQFAHGPEGLKRPVIRCGRGMHERSKNPFRDDALARILKETADELPQTGLETKPLSQPEKNPHAVALGRLGGLKGGAARAKSLTKKRRVAIAKKAAKARWGRG